MKSDKIKVLYLINFAGKAGTEKYVENLIDYLPNNEFEAHLCYNIPGELSEKCEAKGIPCHRLSMKSPFDRKAVKSLSKLCIQEKIDVIHAQYPRENFIALQAKKRLKSVKVVFTSHLTLYQNAVWKFFNKKLTPLNDAVISVCREGEKILIENKVDKSKIHVIYNGIDTSKIPPRDRSYLKGIADGDAVVGIALARLSPEKGLDFLIDSVFEAKKTLKRKLCILICGDGKMRESLQRHIDEKELGDTIKLLGYRTDTAKLLCASDFAINCASSNEALSFALLESLGSSLPLVTTDVGGNRDLCEYGGKAGICVSYGDTEAFASALKAVCENDREREEMGRLARHKAENEFDLNSLLFETVKLYY
ncbi:MAG: glycosyltransferase [Clostridia bacterium]|nr:glycosyltransferase [Clostridia bacterium]